jgi:predicted nucleic acid-binding protein
MADKGPIVYFDSNPFIYFLEGTPDLMRMLNPLFRALSASPSRAATSEITLGEVLAPSTRPGGWPLELKRRAYVDLIVRNAFIRLEPVTREVILETAALRVGTALKLVDAIHLATAITSGCRYLLTADWRLAAPSGLTKVLPDNAGVAQLLRVIA